MPNNARDDRGFALPLTLFLIAVLTLMLGATFTRAATEIRIAAGSKSAMDALFVAQSGLEKYFGQDFTASYYTYVFYNFDIYVSAGRVHRGDIT